MKDFDVSTITRTGAQLLAQATEGNRLIVSGCEANTTVYTSETAKAVTAPTGARISNDVSIVFVQDNRILIRALFTQSETTGGNANSLVLFGRLANDPAETRTAICVVSNNAQFYLPSSTSEAVQDFECLFTIDYEIQSNVVVEQTSALECSLAEFRLLKERTVTAHKEGDPNVGDPTQNIFGAKVFRSQIGFVSKANFTSLATFNGGIAVNDEISIPDNDKGTIVIGSDQNKPHCTLIASGIEFENKDWQHPRKATYGMDNLQLYSVEAHATVFSAISDDLKFGEQNIGNDSYPTFWVHREASTEGGFIKFAPIGDGEYGLVVQEDDNIGGVSIKTSTITCNSFEGSGAALANLICVGERKDVGLQSEYIEPQVGEMYLLQIEKANNYDGYPKYGEVVDLSVIAKGFAYTLSISKDANYFVKMQLGSRVNPVGKWKLLTNLEFVTVGASVSAVVLMIRVE